MFKYTFGEYSLSNSLSEIINTTRFECEKECLIMPQCKFVVYLFYLSRVSFLIIFWISMLIFFI